jgi:hypothetical protein
MVMLREAPPPTDIVDWEPAEHATDEIADLLAYIKLTVQNQDRPDIQVLFVDIAVRDSDADVFAWTPWRDARGRHVFDSRSGNASRDPGLVLERFEQWFKRVQP